MLDRLKSVFASLRKGEVRYLVLGGIAAALHGVPRATFDLDLYIEPTLENARRTLHSLKKAGLGTADLLTAEDLLANEITVFKDRVRIDVMTSSPGLDFSSAWKRKVVMEYQGETFPVICREDLIASKKASGRPVDLEDVRILENIKD